MYNNKIMKGILANIILMSLVSKGLCIKCYVGVGDVGISAVEEEDGFATCTYTIAVIGIISSVTRAGLNITETTGCQELAVEGVKSRICHCDTELCNNALDTDVFLTGPTIKCYVGVGNVGSPEIKEVEGFKTCAVSTAVEDDMKIIIRVGLAIMINTSCIEEVKNGTTDRICYCNTDHCNSEGSTLKCYVGVGNVGSRNVNEIEGFETCSVSTHVADNVKVITRTGSALKFNTSCMKEEGNDSIERNCFNTSCTAEERDDILTDRCFNTSCMEEERDGTTYTICQCNENLCNNAGSTIKCYVGVGNVGSRSVDDIEGFETCSVSTNTSHGHRVVTHAGLSVSMNTSCFDEEVNGTKTKNRICYCNEDLCNSTAGRLHAIVVDLVKAFATWVKSLFDDESLEKPTTTK